MAVNSDVAFKFGCGRYIQEENAIEKNLYNELKRLGNKALFVAGKNGYKAAIENIKKAVDNTDIEYEIRMFYSVPCLENAQEIASYIEENGFEIVCGVGGGVIGDSVKLAAEITDVALVQIPTSSATCVAASALSVMYDRETRVFRGSYICKKEADAVIVDTRIMINQPPRLFWAGLIDSKAKMVEIRHYFMNGKAVPLGLEMAWAVSKEVDSFYDKNMNEMSSAIDKKEITKTFETALFYIIAVTGIISGLSKNSSQTALGHDFYYAVRTNFCEEAKDFLHGEIVGIGLIVQLAFNGLSYAPLRNLLKEMKLPVSFSEINIIPNEKNIKFFIDKVCENKSILATDDDERERVKSAINAICK